MFSAWASSPSGTGTRRSRAGTLGRGKVGYGGEPAFAPFYWRAKCGVTGRGVGFSRCQKGWGPVLGYFAT